CLLPLRLPFRARDRDPPRRRLPRRELRRLMARVAAGRVPAGRDGLGRSEEGAAEPAAELVPVPDPRTHRGEEGIGVRDVLGILAAPRLHLVGANLRVELDAPGVANPECLGADAAARQLAGSRRNAALVE